MAKDLFYLFSVNNILIMILIFVILFVLIISSTPLFEKGFSKVAYVLTSSIWDPVHDRYGIFFAIGGSLVVALIAIIIALILSISTAVFIVEISPSKIRAPLEMMVDLGVAVPSVVYGLWGLYILTPFLRDHVMTPLIDNIPGLKNFLGFYSPSGTSIFTAGVLLGIMIYPFATSIIREALKLIPFDIKEALYSLGLTKWEVIKNEIFYIKNSILAGLLLAFGRAVGETVAVAMVVGNIVNPEFYKIFMPGYTIASLLANQFLNATGIMIPILYFAALILFSIGFIVNIIVALYLHRSFHR